MINYVITEPLHERSSFYVQHIIPNDKKLQQNYFQMACKRLSGLQLIPVYQEEE